MMIMCDSEKMGLPRPPPSNEWTQQNIMMINPPTGTAAPATTSSSSSGSKVAAVGGGGGGAMAHQQDPLKCPRCDSSNTKFCYYNNYSLAQPRHFCKACKRYWTRGGTLRNVPVGGGCRKNKRVKKHQSAAAAAALPSTTPATAPVTVSSSSTMVGAPPQTSSQIRSSSDLISSFFYGTSDTNLGLNYTSFQPQFSALGFNSGIMNSIQPSSTMASYGNQGVMANYDNTLANSLGLMKGVKVEGGQSTNPNSSAVESWQVMNSTTNPFDQGFSVDSNPSNYLYWSNSADPASSSLAPLF